MRLSIPIPAGAALCLASLAHAGPLAVAATDATYGHRETAQWHAVSLTANGATLNVTLSTTLSRTWLPGAAVCNGARNHTGCVAGHGGLYTGGGDFPTRADFAAAGVGYAGLNGTGRTGTLDKLGLVSTTSSREVVLRRQPAAVFETLPPGVPGYLSLSATAKALKAAGETESAALQLVAEYSVDVARATRLMVVFGGYDQLNIDLNRTQRWGLGEAGRMEVTLDKVVWSGKDMQTPLLGTGATAVIDTNTPYLWLPQPAFAAFLDVSGARWNATLDSYVFTKCLSEQKCTAAEEAAATAILELAIGPQTVRLPIKWFFMLETGLWDSFDSLDLRVLPVRKLADDAAPVVLGRAVVQGLHLWVDYDANYFNFEQVVWNASDPKQYSTDRSIVAWDAASHAPITGASVLYASPPSSPTTSSTSSSTPSAENPKPVDKPTVIGGIVGGGAGALLLLCTAAWCFLQRRRRRRNRPRAPTNTVSGPYQLHGDHSEHATLVGEMYAPGTAAPVVCEADSSIGVAYYKLSELPAARLGTAASEKMVPLAPTFPPHPAVGGVGRAVGGVGRTARGPVYEM
ncbi:hypothetical protein EDC01DRAFT_633853 [Geopyxis carbonaria]|nr:hypothetical protein EDC01DRAFT_633853 [Geopyxis carbonaria]